MKNRNIALCILFSIITINLYTLYWIVQITENTNAMARPQKRVSGGTVLLLEIITLGIYGYFWSWRIGTLHSDVREERGLPGKECGVLYLICMFLFPLLSLSFMQHEINQYIGGGLNDSLYETAGDSVKIPAPGIGAYTAGMAGIILFSIFSLLLLPCYSSDNGFLFQIWSILWREFLRDINHLFAIVHILAGISAFLIIPLLISRSFKGASRIWERLSVGVVIVLGIILLIHGFLYEDIFVYMTFSMQSVAVSMALGISLGIVLLAVCVCIGGFCFTEARCFRYKHCGYGYGMTFSGVLFAIVALLIIYTFFTGYNYYYPSGIPVLLPYLGATLFVFGLVRLYGLLLARRADR